MRRPFSTVLRALPREFPIPVVVMQHLAPGSNAAEIYARSLPFPVEWLQANARITAGKVAVCPPRSYVEVLPDSSCLVLPCAGGAKDKPIDRLLESVARSFGPRAIGVILSGMLDDGALGARQLHEAGGTVLVQTDASAEFPAMPRAAIQVGAADLIVPLADIAQVICDLTSGTQRPRPRSELDAIRRVFGEQGEVAARAREIDWSKTALGPVLEWPEHLRVVACTVLQSAYPMALWWGPELIQLYNDQWRSFLGAARHPQALSARAPEAWPQVWQHFGPMVQHVLSSGQAMSREDYLLFLDRHGYSEEVYVTFSNSPIRDPQGNVVRVLHTSWDTTRNVVAERRVRTLRALAAQIAGATTPRRSVSGPPLHWWRRGRTCPLRCSTCWVRAGARRPLLLPLGLPRALRQPPISSRSKVRAGTGLWHAWPTAATRSPI